MQQGGWGCPQRALRSTAHHVPLSRQLTDAYRKAEAYPTALILQQTVANLLRLPLHAVSRDLKGLSNVEAEPELRQHVQTLLANKFVSEIRVCLDVGLPEQHG